MSARRILGAVAVGRLLFGIWMLVSPREVAARWLGRAGTGAGDETFVRAVGGRDIAYALGSLNAVRSGGDPKPWLVASALVDGTDGLATLAAEDVPQQQRLLSASVAFSTVAISIVAALAADED